MTKMYYEAHVTIDPVEDDLQLAQLKNLAEACQFRVAKLLLRKGRGPSTDDAFMTSRSDDWEEIKFNTRILVRNLRRAGFGVRRYKIEDTLMDSKIEDQMGLLS